MVTRDEVTALQMNIEREMVRYHAESAQLEQVNMRVCAYTHTSQHTSSCMYEVGDRTHKVSPTPLQSSIPMADERVKETARQVADIFDERVGRMIRVHSSGAGSQVTPRTPNTPPNEPQGDEITAIVQQ